MISLGRFCCKVLSRLIEVVGLMLILLDDDDRAGYATSVASSIYRSKDKHMLSDLHLSEPRIAIPIVSEGFISGGTMADICCCSNFL